MNALLRLGVGAILVLPIIDFAYAQKPVAAKLLDSVSPIKEHLSAAKTKLADQKNKSPFSNYAKTFETATPSSVLKANGIAIGSGLQRIGNNYRAIYSVEGQLSLFHIPIDLQINNNQPNNLFENPLRGNLFKASFDRKALMKSMVPELAGYQQLKEQIFSGRSASSFLREKMMSHLKTEGAEQQKKLSGVYDHINQYGNIEQLLKLDDKGLRNKLEALAKNKKDSLSHLGAGFIKDHSTQGDELTDQMLDSLTNQVIGIRKQLEANGISPSRIGDIEKMVDENKGDINGYISRYNLNGLKQKGWQSLLNRLGDVELGSFGEQLPGSFMNQDLFLQGGSVSLQTPKGAIQFGLASSQDIGFIKDAGFSRSNFNIPKYLTFLSIPVIGNGYAKGRISWAGSIEKQSYRLNESAGISPRSGSALTLSQELGGEKMGKFTFELSKSAAAFRNVGQIGSEHVLLERNTFGNYFRDDLFETMAFGVKYDINDQKSRLNTNLFFNYSGIGFQNPAQQGFGNMGLRMGGSLRKGFLKNKVMLNLRGDLKNTPVSGTTDAHWQNHNLNVEARFKVSRKFNFSVKYMDNGVQKSGELQQSVYGSKKYQFDASSSYKLFKKSGFSHLVAGLQEMNNPIAQSSSQFLTTIYTQSLSLGTVTLMANVFYNRELGQQNLLGDMVNADAAVQYRFLDNVTASTAVTYLDNTGQARQMGIKQNAQFSVRKNMEVNLYADIRKNMINPLYPELFASNRAEVSLKYYFR